MNPNCGVSIAQALLILEVSSYSFSNGNPDVGTLSQTLAGFRSVKECRGGAPLNRAS